MFALVNLCVFKCRMDKLNLKYHELASNPQYSSVEMNMFDTSLNTAATSLGSSPAFTLIGATTLGGITMSGGSHGVTVVRKEVDLTPEERKYLLSVERGDIPTVQLCLQVLYHLAYRYHLALRYLPTILFTGTTLSTSTTS